MKWALIVLLCAISIFECSAAESPAISVQAPSERARAIGSALAPLLVAQNGYKKLLSVDHSGIILDGSWKFVVETSKYDTTLDHCSQLTVQNTIAVYSTASLSINPCAPPAYTISHEAEFKNVLKKFVERSNAKKHEFTLERCSIKVVKANAVASTSVPPPISACIKNKVSHLIEVNGSTDETQAIGKALAPLLLEQNGLKKLFPVGQSGRLLANAWTFVVQDTSYSATRDHCFRMTIHNTISIYSTASFLHDSQAPPTYTVSHVAAYKNVLKKSTERAKAQEQVFALEQGSITVNKAGFWHITPAPLPAYAGKEQASTSLMDVHGASDEARVIGRALAPLLCRQDGVKTLLSVGQSGLIINGSWKFVVQNSDHTTTPDHCSEMAIFNTIAVYSTASLSASQHAPPAYIVSYKAFYENVLDGLEDRARAEEHEFIPCSATIKIEAS